MAPVKFDAGIIQSHSQRHADELHESNREIILFRVDASCSDLGFHYRTIANQRSRSHRVGFAIPARGGARPIKRGTYQTTLDSFDPDRRPGGYRRGISGAQIAKRGGKVKFARH